jgi:uncharacterized membrane protein
MKKDKNSIILFVLSLVGFSFSGYLSGVKFFTKTCAFNESCPYFLGYPACYFGFAMFLALAIFSFFSLFSKIQIKNGAVYLGVISLLGVLFAGYFTLLEIPVLFKDGFNAYILGLPTCAFGLLFYVAIFILSVYRFLLAARPNGSEI